ncbi:hypothetical protein B0H12DRAFT_1235397 [Mycena haematopus]|nr:hypothetical protein B0H12DRAFT_1235397 [Mycena haematopus]
MTSRKDDRRIQEPSGMILLLFISRRFLSPPLPSLSAHRPQIGRLLEVSTPKQQPVMQQSFIILLFLTLVHAVLQNYTVDDTSSDITYGGHAFPCNPTTCPDGILDKDPFNNTITLTDGNITFSFTGTALYTSLYLIGAASIVLDGKDEGTFTYDDILGLDQQPIFSKTDLLNGPHTLVIAPTTPNGTVVGFDHLVYTAVLPTKNHVSAIVGGVIGGVVLTIGALFAALYTHRRKLIVRRNQRKAAVLCRMTADRPADHKATPEDGKNLPV